MFTDQKFYCTLKPIEKLICSLIKFECQYEMLALYEKLDAKALFIFATWGMGNYIGTLFTGYIWDTFKTPAGETIWWQFFLVPATLCIIMGIIFFLFFRDDPEVTEEDLKSV